MNPLKKFEYYHIKKILIELKLAGIDLIEENIPKIIEETSFQVRSKKHTEECLYYSKGKPCNDIEEFNCFFCPCPEYKSEIDEGGCKINCIFGKWHSPYPNSQSRRVWDCSDCSVPHFPQYVEQYLKQNMEKLKKISDEI